MGRSKPRHEAHVRVYKHEWECPAYRALTPTARALLVEFRKRYKGAENKIPYSQREMQQDLGISQRPTAAARRELLDKGWVRELTPGAFHRKARHAAEYALTNEPLHQGRGETAPKDYMRWGRQKSTVVDSASHGSEERYRRHKPQPASQPSGSRHDYRDATSATADGSRNGYTDTVTTAASQSKVVPIHGATSKTHEAVAHGNRTKKS